MASPSLFFQECIFFSQFSASFLPTSLSQKRLKGGTLAKAPMLSMHSIDREALLHKQQWEGYFSIKIDLNRVFGLGSTACTDMDFKYCDRKIKLDRNSLTSSSLFFKCSSEEWEHMELLCRLFWARHLFAGYDCNGVGAHFKH